MLILKQPIQIDDDTQEVGYGIDVDEFNIILYKLNIVKSGKRVGEIGKSPMGYYTSIKQVLERVLHNEAYLLGVDDIKSLTAHLDTRIDACVDSLGKLSSKDGIKELFDNNFIVKI